MYVDSPGDHVFSLFDELLFGRHPLGREIAGTPRSVRRARHDRVVEHWQHWYQPANLVLAAAGSIRHRDILKIAQRWFDGDGTAEAGRFRSPRRSGSRRRSAGSVRVAFRRLSQGNLCIGMPGGGAWPSDRWALDLLGAVLGDGMSSRLFIGCASDAR